MSIFKIDDLILLRSINYLFNKNVKEISNYPVITFRMFDAKESHLREHFCLLNDSGNFLNKGTIIFDKNSDIFKKY